ncbi:MAG: succinate dehydrogenase iron-sulfur subunit [Chloroflexota bacterium]|nr:succinate dehydrogenase iron-sulfur subunit [Chloroflexota bacterium]
MQMKFKILRFDPDKDQQPYYQQYNVLAEPEERILDCLNRIRGEQDGTLAYRMSCGHGICGSDAMRIDGVCRIACQELVRNHYADEVVIEPLPGYVVQKDLMVDLEPFFQKVKLVKPHLITLNDAPDKERRQSPTEQRKLDQIIRCILCACCTSSCPVSLENESFLGPAPLIWAFRRVFDSRDTHHVERLQQLDCPDGAWGCKNHFECTRVCPKQIPITKSINQMKREIESILR